MIVDVTGTPLTPGNNGRDCLGNGTHVDENGQPIECCCEECDYYLCCTDPSFCRQSPDCWETRCPHHPYFATCADENSVV